MMAPIYWIENFLKKPSSSSFGTNLRSTKSAGFFAFSAGLRNAKMNV